MIILALSVAAITLGKPFAIGPLQSIEKMARASRRCGMSVNFDKMDKVTVLLIGKEHSRPSIECTLKWKKLHRKELHLISFFGEP